MRREVLTCDVCGATGCHWMQRVSKHQYPKNYTLYQKPIPGSGRHTVDICEECTYAVEDALNEILVSRKGKHRGGEGE